MQNCEYSVVNLNSHSINLQSFSMGYATIKAKAGDLDYWVCVQRTTICFIISVGLWLSGRRGGKPLGTNEISTFMLKRDARSLVRDQVEFAREISMAQQVVQQNPDLYFS